MYSTIPKAAHLSTPPLMQMKRQRTAQKGANPSEKSTDLQLEIVLLPVLLGVACTCAVVGVLVWRHNKRIHARKGGSTASLASLNVVRPMNAKPTFDPKSQFTTTPAVAIK
ncbi:hypothetical protein DPMN_163224 [Dreissena polymorpha]|uniref:Uncharacterized protein n=1 Tax=Dreissena polymorpha TaxID=45954 RepID=A0A9D4EQS9_DREPO|nr:hypothetical protein DPMN_163224 [Dreissena polymorpha]